MGYLFPSTHILALAGTETEYTQDSRVSVSATDGGARGRPAPGRGASRAPLGGRSSVYGTHQNFNSSFLAA